MGPRTCKKTSYVLEMQHFLGYQIKWTELISTGCKGTESLSFMVLAVRELGTRKMQDWDNVPSGRTDRATKASPTVAPYYMQNLSRLCFRFVKPVRYRKAWAQGSGPSMRQSFFFLFTVHPQNWEEGFAFVSFGGDTKQSVSEDILDCERAYTWRFASAWEPSPLQLVQELYSVLLLWPCRMRVLHWGTGWQATSIKLWSK